MSGYTGVWSEVMSRCTGVWSEVMSGYTGVWSEVMSGCTGVWSEVMSPGGREVATSGREREDAGPGLLTIIRFFYNALCINYNALKYPYNVLYRRHRKCYQNYNAMQLHYLLMVFSIHNLESKLVVCRKKKILSGTLQIVSCVWY